MRPACGFRRPAETNFYQASPSRRDGCNPYRLNHAPAPCFRRDAGNCTPEACAPRSIGAASNCVVDAGWLDRLSLYG